MLKRSTFALAVPFVLLATIAAARTADDGFAFKRIVKEGDSAKYTLKAKLAVQGMDVDVEGVSTETIKKVNEDGSLLVSTVQGDMTISYGGQTMNNPGGEEVLTTTDARGKVIKIESKTANDDAYRLAQLTTVLTPEKPVKVGDKWSVAIDADKEKSIPKSTADYEVLGLEKLMDHDVVKVKFTVEEKEGDNPASSTGILYLDAVTSMPIKSEAKWVNAPIQGNLASGDVVVTLTK